MGLGLGLGFGFGFGFGVRGSGFGFGLASAAPRAPHEIPYLAELRHAKGPPSPRAWGSIAASGTRTSSSRMEPVIEARRESLPGQG